MESGHGVRARGQRVHPRHPHRPAPPHAATTSPRVIESRLPLVPLFRRRLVAVPFGLDQPYWVDDPDFDIEFHVRALALPSPGSDAQLAEQVAAPARPAAGPQPAAVGALPDLRPAAAAARRSTPRSTTPRSTGSPAVTSSAPCSTSPRRAGPAPEEQPFEGETPPGAAWLLARSAVDPGHATGAGRPPGHRAGPSRSPGLAVAARPLAERDRPAAATPALMSGAGLRAPRHPVQRPHLGPPALGHRRPAARRGQGGPRAAPS